MGLKQIDDLSRVVFLSMFVDEMFRHYIRKYESKKNVEFEKVKKKILEPFPEDVSVLKNIDSGKIVGEVMVKKIKPVNFEYQNDAERKKIRKIPIHLTRGLAKPVSLKNVFLGKKRKSVRPVNVQFGMKNINKLLRDNSIQSIECPGPGKNLIVKRNNKINVTKMIFGSVQIKEVMDYFSMQARIPVVQGILKAAVGDLVISAVSSKFVGSRFIITRKTPYSLIERNNNFKNK
jgi:hypothetical protein